ncbi:MAG: hypothetical protein ABIJ08_05475 [Nanoarchaeota archaeon]
MQILMDGKYHSYGDLERKVNTNWQTIRNHCKDLELFKAVTISDSGIKITDQGKKIKEELTNQD